MTRNWGKGVADSVAGTMRSDGRVEVINIFDGIRGLAALYVMLGHSRQLLWAGTRAQAAHAAGASGLGRVVAQASASLGFGHKAVILFFIVSGFCIHYRQARVRPTGITPVKGFDVVAYARRRARRLYPPLIWALALTALFDAVAGSLSSPFLHSSKFGSDSVGTLIGNLLMQADMVVQHYGTDFPLWSLAFEFWFYVLYPVLLLAAVQWGSEKAFYGVCALSAASLLVLLAVPLWPVAILAYWVVWTIGMLLAEMHFKGARPRSWAAIVAVAVVGAVIWRLSRSGVAADVVVGCGFAAATGALVLGRSSPALDSLRWLLAGPLSVLGKISYSLYLTHYPLFVVIGAAWVRTHGSLPTGAELSVFGVCAALAVATVSYFLVERRFTQRHPGVARAHAAA